MNLLVLTFFSSCASKFIVKSDPLQADVYILDAKTAEKKVLGKTPIEMSVEDVRKAVVNAPSSGEFLTVVIEKSGYDSISYNLPMAKFMTLQTALDVKMKVAKPETDPKKEAQTAKEMAKSLLDKIFLAQRFALASQFERAHIEMDQVIKDHPDFARALSMRASIYYAQKNYNESLKWYEEAVKIDPQMEEAVKMIAQVKAVMSGSLKTGVQNRLPASGRNR